MSTSNVRLSPVLLGLVLLVGACDPKVSASGAAASTVAAASDTPSPSSAASEVKTSAVGPRSTSSAVPAVGATFVDAPEAHGISVATHTIVSPKRTGDAKEDYWIQYKVFGEMTNRTDKVLESMSAQMTFHGADGKMLGVESIGTLSAQDAGDFTPGESLYAEVHFVQPGQSVPFFFTRNLAAIDGDIAYHQLAPKRAIVADTPPKAVLVDVVDAVNDDKRTFTGTIRNDGDGGCRAPQYLVAFRDSAGKIASVERFYATDDLQKVLGKGESMPFTASIFAYDDTAWRATAKVDGYVDCQP